MKISEVNSSLKEGIFSRDAVKAAEKELAKDFKAKMKQAPRMANADYKALAKNIAQVIATRPEDVPQVIAKLVNDKYFKSAEAKKFAMEPFAGDVRNKKQLYNYMYDAIRKATQIEVYGTASADPNTAPVPTDAAIQKDPEAAQVAQQADPNATGGAAAAQVDANKDGKDDKTGEPMQPVDANKDGKDDNTGEPMPQDGAATTDEPVEKTDNNAWDTQFQAYLQSKGIARGGFTHAEMEEFLKVNGYAQPDKWIKQAGVNATNKGKVVSNDELKQVSAYIDAQELGGKLDTKGSGADPAAAQADGAADAAAAGGAEIPQDIKAELDKLTPQQKQELQKALAA